MLPINFNHLYYFWVVAREGSITSAQSRLLLTQSTLSLQLQKLERAVGKKLTTRGRHGVALTVEGRLMFDYAEKIFIPAEHILDQFSAGRPPRSPTLKLGVAEGISPDILFRVTRFLRKTKPDYPYRVCSGTPEDLRARLTRRSVDIVLSDADMATDLGRDFRSRLIGRLALYFAASPTVARRIRNFPADLAHVPMILRNSENNVRKEVDHFLYKHRLSPHIAAEIDGVNRLSDLVMHENAVAVFDEISLEGLLRTGRLMKLHRKPLSFRQNIWIVFRRHHREEPELQAVIDRIVDNYRLR